MINRSHVLGAVAGAILGIAFGAVYYATRPPAPLATTNPDMAVTDTATAPANYAAGATCHAQLPLPDPTCTPGLTNPDVTQATIGSTICKSGWTATVRPPESVTGPQKIVSMQQYGDPPTPAAFEYDHFLPLEMGGAVDDPRNLWPQPLTGPLNAHVKDAVENAGKAAICSGRMTLAEAQTALIANWPALCKKLAADPSC
jgi:hypothetical protein